MNQVDKGLENLIEAVKNSAEYLNYQEAKAKVDKDPVIKEWLDEFRARNFEIQNNNEETELYHAIDRITKESEKYRTKPLVNEFLAAELALCRMIQNINWKLIDALDFDIAFIEE